TSTAMASGRVVVAGAPGDALLEWLRTCLKESGYDPTVLAPAGAAAAAPITPAPVVAGFDLWRTAGEERFEALAALDERLPPGRPLLALCNALSVDEAASYTVRAGRVVGFSLFGILREGMLAEVLPGLGTDAGAVQRAVEVLAALGLQTQ